MPRKRRKNNTEYVVVLQEKFDYILYYIRSKLVNDASIRLPGGRPYEPEVFDLRGDVDTRA